MKLRAHRLAVLLLWLALASFAFAQQPPGSVPDRAKVSTLVGMDVAHSIDQVKNDIDLAAFERALRNALDGGESLLSEADRREVGQALRQVITSRSGQAAPGAAASGSQTSSPPKDKAGLLVGADIGRSLIPFKSELDLALFMQSLRTTLAGGPAPLDAAQADQLRNEFSQWARTKVQAAAAELGAKNKVEGDQFLAKNKTVKGVVTTPSGLQYLVLRQGAGARPGADAQVRVNYRGTLLDGTEFDSSYERGQPAEMPLSGVIAGWREGLTLMPVGAKYRFWIPGDLGYGANGSPGGPIGPNALLIFDVELMDIL